MTIDCEKNEFDDEFGDDLHSSHGSSNSCGVLISFYGNQKITVKKKLSDKKGRILVLHAWIDGFDFLLLNIYSAITEKEQVSVLKELTTILSNFENIDNHVIFADDFNIFFDTSLGPKGGTPT